MMTPTGSRPAPVESRQNALEELLERAEHIPEVADAMKAYAKLQDAMSWRLVSAKGEVRYATGGNEQ